MKFCHSQVNDGTENIILSEVSQAQKFKTAFSLSCVEYRLKTNAAILWDVGHTKRRSHTGGEGKLRI
jgi:hypothetical protein